MRDLYEGVFSVVSHTFFASKERVRRKGSADEAKSMEFMTATSAGFLEGIRSLYRLSSKAETQLVVPPSMWNADG